VGALNVLSGPPKVDCREPHPCSRFRDAYESKPYRCLLRRVWPSVRRVEIPNSVCLYDKERTSGPRKSSIGNIVMTYLTLRSTRLMSNSVEYSDTN
jgi:hypothetical protein